MKEPTDMIVVVPNTESITTIGGIVIPENTHRAIRRGVVEDVGPSKAPDVGLGDTVYYQAAAAVEFEVKGKTIAVLHANNILLIEGAW